MISRKFFSLFLILFSINIVTAQKLCTPDCAIEFAFSDGGSIVATDEIGFIYAAGSELLLGEGGTVNIAVQPLSLDLSTGGVLNLAVGESIDFGANGFLSLAQGSNLDANKFDVISGDLILVGTTLVTLTHTVNVDGTLEIQTPGLTPELSVGNSASNNLTLINDVIVANNTLSGNVDISTPDVFVIAPVTINDVEFVSPLTVSEISLTPATVTEFQSGEVKPLENLSELDGFELTTINGVKCTVNSNQCVANNGDNYALVDGNLIKQNSGSGSIGNGIGLLLMAFVVLLLRKFK